MADVLYRDPDIEWLDHVQPVGLVVAPSVLKELGLTPLHQSPVDTAEAAEHLNPDVSGPALPDPWAFMEKVLGWNAAHVAGAPGGPELPDTLLVSLPEHCTTLAPTWAVAELGQNGQPWQLLVRIEAGGIEPDGRAQLDGWEASPHQRFERLLRDTGVFAGLLITDRELRLINAPRGETSGYLSFPLRPLGMVAGRPMLGGLKLLLDSSSLFTAADTHRLPALLKKSRDAQASVSTELAGQVLGALHELLRGLDASDSAMIRDLARANPGHVYEGLLTVLMRLVFILYAEDRDLLPSRADARARAIYETSYSVRGLYARIVEDAALNPDTMDERRGGWGQLLALFRLIHKGHPSHFVQARGGKLFDPDEFPFIEGRANKDDPPRILNVSDGCILRILEGLMTLKLRGQERQRLSYRTLDVEQIGSVYETVMGFTVEVAESRVLAIKAGKNNRTPVFAALDELLKRKGKDRIKDLKENVGRSLTAAQAKPVEAAATVEDLATALDGIVDERGSPRHVMAPAGTPILQPTGERRRTGSHYTPRSLTQPIVAHALESAFERLGPDATPDQILDLKVCDPAMGSGAFLVEACRAIASRLVAAWTRWPETRPVIPADEDEELHARRLVAQRCLYGVDKNPRAVDLAKLSLWLATLAKDHEFTFLDHALKCGDSLVGLTKAQIAATHWDTSKPPTFVGKVVSDHLREAEQGREQIQAQAEWATEVDLRSQLKAVDAKLEVARLIGDGVIAAFFSADKPRKRIETLVEFQKLVQSNLGSRDWAEKVAWWSDGLIMGEHPLRPFHWAVEFPEVFGRDNPGFDAIVGNPPFLGGSRISSELSDRYLHYLLQSFTTKGDKTDLALYFFALAEMLLRTGGVAGLVATNTVAQGDSRATLRLLKEHGFHLFRAIRRFPWPGDATVIVSILHLQKSIDRHPKFIDDDKAKHVSVYLKNNDLNEDPNRLSGNVGKIYEGFGPYGAGFLLEDGSDELHDIERSGESGIVFPYIGGEDVLNSPTGSSNRKAIYIGKMPREIFERQYPKAYSLVERTVKPERDKKSRRVASMPWWQFLWPRPELRAKMDSLRNVFVRPRVAKHQAFMQIPSTAIISNSANVVCSEKQGIFAVLQSRLHEVWARFFGSTLEDRLRYTPSDCFETFPFPEDFETSLALEAAGQAYHDHRAVVMVARNEGMTKTYNRFHDRNETAADIVRLRELHTEMDRAVLEAYGWRDFAERVAPIFLDESNEEDHTYQGRLFWHSDFRDEVLARLLALNAERAEAERAAGLTVAPDRDDEEVESEEEAS